MNAHGKMARRAITTTLLIISIISSGCGSLFPTPSPTATPTPTFTPSPIPSPTLTPTPTELPHYKVGDIIESTNYFFIVLGWANVPGTKSNTPYSGMKYVAVDMLLVNKQKRAAQVNIESLVRLLDDTGQEYTVSEDATSAADGAGIFGIKVDGALAPGDKVRGMIGFYVPEPANEFRLKFTIRSDPGIAPVDLGSEPITVEQPSEIPGATPQEYHKIGEVIELGDATFTIHDVSYNSGDDYGNPDPSTKYVAFDIALSNASDSMMYFVSLFQVSLKGFSGRKYDANLEGDLSLTPPLEVPRGKTSRGWIIFKVAEDESGYIFMLRWENTIILIATE